MVGWYVKFFEKSEYVLWVVEDAVFGASAVKEGHQVCVIGAGNLVLIAIGADVALLHAWEKTVELGVKIFAIAFTQGHADAEAEDAADLGSDTGV